MIEFNNIKKSFKDRTILNNVSGKFEQGKVNLIIGASGEGKSVLLKCLVGLIPIESGDVFFNDENFSNGSPESRTKIRKKIGMLFQNFALMPHRSVIDNIAMPLEIRGINKNQRYEEVDKIKKCQNKLDLGHKL